MEPPKPAILKDEIVKESKKIESFKIMDQEEKDKYYLIEFFIEKDYLIIYMKSFESKIKLIYENKYSFSDFLKINKYFKLFDSLDEIAEIYVIYKKKI